MKLVKQKNNHDCGLTSLFMLNDNRNFRHIKKFCKRHLNYNPNKGNGIFINSDKICNQLKILGVDSYFASAGRKSIVRHTKYNRAMILVYNEEKGHCIARNGYCCYDPAENETYSEKLINVKHQDFSDCSIIVFKTPLYERALSFIKKPFYDLVH